MSKKLIATICIAVLLTIGFVLVAVGIIGPGSETKGTSQSITIPNFNSVPKTASLYFSSPLVSATTNPVKVDIIVETGGQAISGTQLELTYDPEIISNITVSSPQDSFFGSPADYKILHTNIDDENGTLSFTVAANNRSLAKKGNGKVASLTFNVNRNAGAKSTNVSFAPTTLVTIFGASQTVLRQASGLTIVLDPTLSKAQ